MVEIKQEIYGFIIKKRKLYMIINSYLTQVYYIFLLYF
jgi:hypothetical protein